MLQYAVHSVIGKSTRIHHRYASLNHSLLNHYFSNNNQVKNININISAT